ncbi:type II toxin-antitoxin system HicA family toxin [Anabaena sp. FACHB-1391]|uniref:type II toxin-antitoxin system HicA family toxin n=1 Tax=Anabaena sp. FACHB-1391 TaxID=2692771 RepID=UPI00321F9E22
MTRKLGKLGFEFYLAAKGDHEIWFNAATNQKTTIPHHGEIKEGTLRSILKQAQIDVDIFLDV